MTKKKPEKSAKEIQSEVCETPDKQSEYIAGLEKEITDLKTQNVNLARQYTQEYENRLKLQGYNMALDNEIARLRNLIDNEIKAMMPKPLEPPEADNA
jgi:uncharacterized protein YggE